MLKKQTHKKKQKKHKTKKYTYIHKKTDIITNLYRFTMEPIRFYGLVLKSKAFPVKSECTVQRFWVQKPIDVTVERATIIEKYLKKQSKE